MDNLNTQTHLLTKLFFEKVKQKIPNEAGDMPVLSGTYEQKVTDNVILCLSSGIPYDYLTSLALQATEDDKGCYTLEEYILSKDPSLKIRKQSQLAKNPLECIEFNKFYYHPKLQISSRPPRYELNMKTMEFVQTPREPFFLEIKESFTIEDLTLYYIQEGEIDDTDPSRYYSQFRKLVNSYGIDFVLYLIDASVAKAKSEQASLTSVPSFMMDNIKETKQMYAVRKQIAIEGGLTHVYPRREVAHCSR